MQRQQATHRARTVRFCSVLALTVPTVLASIGASAEQPPTPCHPNPNAAADDATVANRGDVVNLPQPLKDRLVQLADRPHSYLPLQVFNEADPATQGPSQLFQYYLLDTTGFQPNVFTTIFPGVNDHVQLTVTGANCGLETIGAVRVVLEPKPGLPTDPNNPRAFNDVFTDISPLFVINNESGWYEGWMIHDITVPNVAAPRKDGHAQFGTITERDADIIERMGTGNNIPGNVFTVDGRAPHFPSASDHFPDKQTNVVPLNASMGAYNAYQQSDVHSYWEFNYQGTNWIHPLYELPFTGGFPDDFGQAPDAFQDGEIGKLQSIVPGPGPSGEQNEPQVVGDNPTFRVIQTNLTATSMRSANSASAVYRAASQMRFISMSTNGRLPSNRRSEISSNGCSMPMPPRSNACPGMTTVSSPPRRATSTPRRTASWIIHAYSYHQRCSTASP